MLVECLARLVNPDFIPHRYLYQSTSPAVQEYLCNRLHDLPEKALEKYLLQLVYIAVERPSSTLEQAIIDLCSKSFRIAVKVGMRAAGRHHAVIWIVVVWFTATRES